LTAKTERGVLELLEKQMFLKVTFPWNEYFFQFILIEQSFVESDQLDDATHLDFDNNGYLQKT
jgi:hypothetical protein